MLNPTCCLECALKHHFQEELLLQALKKIFKHDSRDARKNFGENTSIWGIPQHVPVADCEITPYEIATMQTKDHGPAATRNPKAECSDARSPSITPILTRFFCLGILRVKYRFWKFFVREILQNSNKQQNSKNWRWIETTRRLTIDVPDPTTVWEFQQPHIRPKNSWGTLSQSREKGYK